MRTESGPEPGDVFLKSFSECGSGVGERAVDFSFDTFGGSNGSTSFDM
jgi:hypothetical protein